MTTAARVPRDGEAAAERRWPARRGVRPCAAAARGRPPARSRPMRSGCVASTHISDEQRHGRRRGDRRRHLDRTAAASAAATARRRSPRRRSRAATSTAIEIEHALHDDRRERGGRAQAFLPRQQIRPQHVADARRQQRRARQSRSPSCGSAVRKRVGPIGASRCCQRTARVQYVDDDERRTRRAAVSSARGTDVPPDVGQVRVAQEPCEQGNRQKRHGGRSHLHRCEVTRIMWSLSPHNISGSFRATAGAVAYGCGVRSHPGKMPASHIHRRAPGRSEPCRRTRTPPLDLVPPYSTHA